MTGYASPGHVVAGGAAASSWANQVSDDLDFLANRPTFRGYQASATTTIANSTSVFTPIGIDTEVSDTGNGHSTTTNNSRWTCPAGLGGYYLVSGIVVFASNATGKRYVGIGVNSATPLTGSQTGFDVVPAGSGVVALQTVVEVFVSPGDYIQLVAMQSSGAGLATAIFGQLTSFLSLRWVATG